MILKKITLTIMVILFLWLLVTSIIGINIHGSSILSNQTDTQVICSISSNTCEDLSILEGSSFDFTTQIIAYMMIVIGISILILNWRISRLENN
ncbi:MAG: hypothetical protein H7196_02985 [candidate division SR1 bacterium]|nr:hypothetical protein [candidate division SR1 bacterium]